MDTLRLVTGHKIPVHPHLTDSQNWLLLAEPHTFEGRYCVSNLACVPMRAEPTEKSEMEGQIMFGEVYQILESKKPWIKVLRFFKDKNSKKWPSMTGWVNEHIAPTALVTENEAKRVLNEAPTGIVVSPAAQFISKNCRFPSILLPAGALLPDYKVSGGKVSFTIQETSCFCETLESTLDVPSKPKIDTLLKVLAGFNGTPYIWGGQTSFGIDCSGLIQTTLRAFGVEIPRNVEDQVHIGKEIHIDESRTGDLLFFKERTGKKVVHVGFIARDETGKFALYHARQRVKLQYLVPDSEVQGALYLPERRDQVSCSARRIVEFS